MSKVIVAGGAGFIGSHLVERLLKDGFEVTVVDNLSSGRESNISGVRMKIEFVKSDISDFDYSERFDAIINLASRASRIEWEKYPVEVALSNSVGSNNLIKLALKYRALYVYASSSEVYGSASVVPTPETYVGSVSTTGSRSPYDEGKRFGEALVKSYEREYGLRSIIVRLFNTYGQRMRGGEFYGRVVDRFIQQALKNDPMTVYGDGTQTRSFAFVSDTVYALSTLLKKGSPGEIYNVGNDLETSILNLARIIVGITGSKSKMEFLSLPSDDPVRRSPDITKVRALGFSPRVSLNEGIRMTVKQNMIH